MLVHKLKGGYIVNVLTLEIKHFFGIFVTFNYENDNFTPKKHLFNEQQSLYNYIDYIFRRKPRQTILKKLRSDSSGLLMGIDIKKNIQR